MKRSRAGGTCAAAAIAVAIAATAGSAAAGDGSARPAVAAPTAAARSETVEFGEREGGVHLFRGVGDAGETAGAPQPEIVSFGARQVRILRGGPAAVPLHTAVLHPAPQPQPQARATNQIERISFGPSTVTVIRGIALAAPPPAAKSDDSHLADLFGPANGDELDRIAFAVEGVESRHGADLRMWRPEFDGPQGPMQVSAAAALDVGGGDRFDPKENRQLGRAYLDRMYRRYGNWPDALKAYNWGPGNLDQWIVGGRNPERLPIGVAHYVSLVLRDALMHTAAFGRLTAVHSVGQVLAPQWAGSSRPSMWMRRIRPGMMVK
jgi:hypothetical protein